jgi:hypothetical protein
MSGFFCQGGAEAEMRLNLKEQDPGEIDGNSEQYAQIISAWGMNVGGNYVEECPVCVRANLMQSAAITASGNPPI